MVETSRPARLWYQSFVHPVEQAPYIERLQALLDAAAGPGIRFEVHGLDPPDHLFHPLTEFRCAAQTIRNALDAERAGYDAFVIGHFQEPGLLEIRGAIDIPVVGLGEATLLAALSMGRQLGLVTIDPVFIDWHERQVRALGLDQQPQLRRQARPWRADASRQPGDGCGCRYPWALRRRARLGLSLMEAFRAHTGLVAPLLRRDIDTRRAPLTGLSEFPNVAEAPPPALQVPEAGPLARRRWAEGFEELRGRVERSETRPTVFLATIGPPHASRIHLKSCHDVIDASSAAPTSA